jgi:hypothetical protein
MRQRHPANRNGDTAQRAAGHPRAPITRGRGTGLIKWSNNAMATIINPIGLNDITICHHLEVKMTPIFFGAHVLVVGDGVEIG